MKQQNKISNIFKKPLQTILSKSGYKIIRNNKVPDPTIEIFDYIFRSVLLEKENLNFVQVGACDGVVSDQASNFLHDTRCHSLLIEPIPANFKSLTSKYSGCSNVKLLNVAVDTKSGKRDIFSVINEGRWLNSSVGKQLASFDKGHLLRFGVLEHEIESIGVTCMTLDEIYSFAGYSKIDILQIDTEGFDDEIVKMALASNVLPKIIYFEYSQIRKKLSGSNLADFYNLLKLRNYRWVHDLRNTIAIFQHNNQ